MDKKLFIDLKKLAYSRCETLYFKYLHISFFNLPEKLILDRNVHAKLLEDLANEINRVEGELKGKTNRDKLNFGNFFGEYILASVEFLNAPNSQSYEESLLRMNVLDKIIENKSFDPFEKLQHLIAQNIKISLDSQGESEEQKDTNTKKEIDFH